MTTTNSQSNLAYKYNRYEEKEAEIREVVKRPVVAKRVGILKAVCGMVVALVVLSALLYAKVVQTELNEDYQKTITAINETKGELAQLQIQLEKQLSLDNIEEIAKNEIGLNEVRPQQIEYVEFTSEQKAEVFSTESFWDKAAQWLDNLF